MLSKIRRTLKNIERRSMLLSPVFHSIMLITIYIVTNPISKMLDKLKKCFFFINTLPTFLLFVAQQGKETKKRLRNSCPTPEKVSKGWEGTVKAQCL